MSINQNARDVVIEALTARLGERHGGLEQPRDWEGGDKIIRALQEAGFQVTAHPEPESPNVAGALDIAAECARYDGGHHKQWVFDQMVRNLTGCPMVDMVNESAVNGPYHYKGLGESEAYREFRATNPHWDRRDCAVTDLTPDEVEVGRRNLIAELQGGLKRALSSVVELDEDTVRGLVAVLEALKPVVVDRAAKSDDQRWNVAVDWLLNNVDQNDYAAPFFAYCDDLISLDELRSGHLPIEELNSRRESHEAALYPKATEGES